MKRTTAGEATVGAVAAPPGVSSLVTCEPLLALASALTVSAACHSSEARAEREAGEGFAGGRSASAWSARVALFSSASSATSSANGRNRTPSKEVEEEKSGTTAGSATERGGEEGGGGKKKDRGRDGAGGGGDAAAASTARVGTTASAVVMSRSLSPLIIVVVVDMGSQGHPSGRPGATPPLRKDYPLWPSNELCAGRMRETRCRTAARAEPVRSRTCWLPKQPTRGAFPTSPLLGWKERRSDPQLHPAPQPAAFLCLACLPYPPESAHVAVRCDPSGDCGWVWLGALSLCCVASSVLVESGVLLKPLSRQSSVCRRAGPPWASTKGEPPQAGNRAGKSPRWRQSKDRIAERTDVTAHDQTSNTNNPPLFLPFIITLAKECIPIVVFVPTQCH